MQAALASKLADAAADRDEASGGSIRPIKRTVVVPVGSGQHPPGMESSPRHAISRPSRSPVKRRRSPSCVSISRALEQVLQHV